MSSTNDSSSIMSIDLFENLIGGGPPPAPNVVDQKYTYKVQNKNEYVQMVSKINSFMQEQISSVTLKTTTQLNLNQSFLAQNITAVGNVTINTDFLQAAKVLQMSQLTSNVVQGMKQTITNSISSAVMQGFKNDNVQNTKSTLAAASSTSLVDSFLAPFTGASKQPTTQQFFEQNTDISNTISNDLQNNSSNSNTATSANILINTINNEITSEQ